MIGKPILKKSKKLNLWPCCSATPAQTTLAEPLIKVPLPPRQAPRAKDQTSGSRGKSNSELLAKLFTIGIIIVVKGMLSMKAEAIPEIHKMVRYLNYLIQLRLRLA